MSRFCCQSVIPEFRQTLPHNSSNVPQQIDPAAWFGEWILQVLSRERRRRLFCSFSDGGARPRRRYAGGRRFVPPANRALNVTRSRKNSTIIRYFQGFHHVCKIEA